ncbi:MAG: hypothetical protein AAF360_00430 [Pseudomonadota bacterium]
MIGTSLLQHLAGFNAVGGAVSDASLDITESGAASGAASAATFEGEAPAGASRAVKAAIVSDAVESAAALSLTGGAGADLLRGDASTADTLEGLTGADTLIGLGGADKLFGGIGKDTLRGGGGDDVLVGDKGRDRLAGGGGDDTLRGGGGKDTMLGGAGADRMFGGGGADSLKGGGRDDTLNGGGGRDELAGGAGDDTLKGGAGADLLHGGRGSDLLTGGGAADVFIFGDVDFASGEIDEISDFTAGQDRIDLFENAAVGRFEDISFGRDGDDLTIEIAGGRIVLRGIGDQNQLSAADFILSGATVADGDASGGDSGGDAGSGDSDTGGGSGDGDTGDGSGDGDTGGGSGDGDTGGGSGDGDTGGGSGDGDTGGGSGDGDTGGGSGGGGSGSGPIQIFGGAGDDTLVGDGGSEEIFGLEGDDVLATGPGLDTLTGGAGADIFDIRLEAGEAGADVDVVTDFSYTLGDKIGVGQALAGVEFSLLSDVVRISLDGEDTMVEVMHDGVFKSALRLLDVHFTIEQLINYGFQAPPGASAAFVPNPTGFQNSTTTSADPDATADGLFVAFVDKQSLDDNPDDIAPVVSTTVDGLPILSGALSTMDVFVRNMATGAIQRVSADGEGGLMRDGDGDPLDAMSPSISSDGRMVAFVAAPNSISAGAAIGDVYVRDLFNDAAPVLVSTGMDGAAVGGVPSGSRTFMTSAGVVALSGDGTRVAYVTEADGVTSAADANGERDVYLKDLSTGETELISIVETTRRADLNDAGGGVINPQTPSADGDAVAISEDGRYVAFVTDAALVDGDSNGVADAYLRDTVREETLLISGAGSGEVTGVALSADAARVAFSTTAALTRGDTNGAEDVYFSDVDLKDFTLTERTFASAPPDSLEFSPTGATGPLVSPDGSQVGFLATVDGATRVFVLDVEKDELSVVDADYDGFPNTAVDLTNDLVALRVNVDSFADSIAVAPLIDIDLL